MKLKFPKFPKKADSEKGAALVMAIMVTSLMAIGAAGLLMEASRNSQNVTDATAEQQAYNAAESGIQSAINVLRYKCTAAASPCQVRPSTLLNSSVPDYNKANTINYARALGLGTSNAPGDTSSAPRLSRWIAYDTSWPDRVKLGQPGVAYNPMTGYAFSLELSDPDNTGTAMALSAVGRLYDHDADDVTKRTYGISPNQVVIKYTPPAATGLTIPGGSAATTTFGTFTYTRTGTGAAIPALNRFEIDINMTVPVPATRVIRGFIEMNATPFITPPKIIFDSQTYDIRGSDVTLSVSGAAMRQTGTQPYGYEATMPSSGNPLTINATISSSAPARILIKSTGYGPRGSKKVLEGVIENNYFNGLGAPATITMVGPPSTTNPSTSFVFDPGNSNAMLYSGQDADAGSTDIIPPIGVTDGINSSGDDPNLDAVVSAVGGKLSDNVVGVPSNVSSEIPPWLSSPAATDAAVKALYNIALNSADPSNPTGRYFPSGVSPSNWGDNATATGITFCDGNCQLGPADGGGILIVTGTLTLHGNFSFNGLIIVTGQGGVIRNGGGNGLIQGNLVIVPYVNSSIAGNLDPAAGAGFLAPQYHTTGGGNSTITYNSNNQLSGLTAVSNIMLGLVEK